MALLRRAPRGAWIETLVTDTQPMSIVSRPAWARGLKPLFNTYNNEKERSRPAWARGLKRA